MFIYLIRNTITNDVYIGKTVKTANSRFREHIRSSENPSIKNSKLVNALRKYGKEHFTVTVIDEACSKQVLSEKEKSWIKFLKPEYNLTRGGEGGNTLEFLDDDAKKSRSEKLSIKIKKIWDDIGEQEKKARLEKMWKRTDNAKVGRMVSKARKEFFANETEEEKQIRIEKARNGSLKVKKFPCCFCEQVFRKGNLKKHQQACSKNPESKSYNREMKKKQQYVYTLVDPNNKEHTTTSFKGFCEFHKLSRYLLKKHIGKVFDCVDDRTNNANAITFNTLGWCLLRIDPL